MRAKREAVGPEPAPLARKRALQERRICFPMMEDLRVVENRGSGIKAMLRAMCEAKSPP